MPRGDGTGPAGGGGAGSGGGRGRMNGPGGGGRMGGTGAGLGGQCVCPECQVSLAHQRGVPCTALKCPKCGAAMVRQ